LVFPQKAARIKAEKPLPFPESKEHIFNFDRKSMENAFDMPKTENAIAFVISAISV
jgi:hypothetical protein